MKFLWLTVVFSSLFSCAIFGQKSDKKVVEKCGILPHCVSSIDDRESFKIKPLKHGHQNKNHAKQEIIDYLKKQPRVEIEGHSENYIHATYSSKLIGFVDDVEFFINDDIVHVRSISRIGISDLGVNRKRVEQIRKDIFN